MSWLGRLLGWEDSDLSVAMTGTDWSRWNTCEHRKVSLKVRGVSRPTVGVCQRCFQPMQLLDGWWLEMDWSEGYRAIKRETWFVGLFASLERDPTKLAIVETERDARLAFLDGAIAHGQNWFRWSGQPPRGGPVRAPKPGDRILVKSATSIYRLNMMVTQVGQDEIVCGEGLGTKVVQISEYGVRWWWPPYPPLED